LIAGCGAVHAPAALTVPAKVGSTGGTIQSGATGCFSSPHVCGYPDESNTGPESGQVLTEATGVVVLTGDEHYEDKRLLGQIEIASGATGVVVKNDEVITDGTCPAPYSIASGCTNDSIDILQGAKGTVFSHDRVGGSEYKGPNTVQVCIRSPYDTPYRAEYVKTLFCAGYQPNGGATLEHDYCPNNYEIGEEHYECIADDGLSSGSPAPLIIKDSTILNAHNQTAAIFLQGYGGSIGEVRIEGDLLAGGGYVIYGGEEEGHNKLKGPEIIEDNRFARCLGKGSCPDSHGYFEAGGFYGLATSINESLTTWSGNYWDDNRTTLAR